MCRSKVPQPQHWPVLVRYWTTRTRSIQGMVAHPYVFLWRRVTAIHSSVLVSESLRDAPVPALTCASIMWWQTSARYMRGRDTPSNCFESSSVCLRLWNDSANVDVEYTPSRPQHWPVLVILTNQLKADAGVGMSPYPYHHDSISRLFTAITRCLSVSQPQHWPVLMFLNRPAQSPCKEWCHSVFNQCFIPMETLNVMDASSPGIVCANYVFFDSSWHIDTRASCSRFHAVRKKEYPPLRERSVKNEHCLV